MSYTSLSSYDNSSSFKNLEIKSLNTIFKESTKLTNEQITTLLNVRKESGLPVLNLDSEEDKDISFIFETIGIVNDYGFAPGLDFVKSYANSVSEKSILDTFIFEVQKKKFKDDTVKMRTKIKINNSGIYKCIKCGSKETSYVAKQLRSGDEGMDYLVACNACGAKFVR
jgi:DNA-directed RNA polymerase subunit M/transcription elongation factor TFIIS